MPLKGFLIASNKSWVNTRLMPLNLPQSDKNSLVWLFLHWFQWNYHDLRPTKLCVMIPKRPSLPSLFKSMTDANLPPNQLSWLIISLTTLEYNRFLFLPGGSSQ